MVDKQSLISIEMNKREEIINTFNKNYLLEAGAGAGKTTIIVQRIINHIISTDINPANLVAITFTKAASTELAERIQLKALEYLKNERDSKIIGRLKAVDRIFTGTIHSFCELILREMPFDANITPNYEIIENDEEFHNNIWYKFLRDNQEEYKETIDSLWKVNIDYKDLKSKAILVLGNPDIKFSGYKDINYNLEDIEKEFKDIQKEYEYLSIEPFKNNSNIAKLFSSILREGEDLIYYSNNLLKEYGKEEFDIEKIFEKVISKKHWNSNGAEEYKRFIERIYNIYFRLNAIVYNTCTDFINMVVDYKREKYEGKLTFNELLYKASTLIKESSLARKYFKNKYKYFYIDEFQDSATR
ncbi:UvrD-helicase domain-containing protein [Tissierella praeacuta]|uniref:UvrD-helicase domain-containing protein n=1 Tax=Tissierella praeacuta TaxID=43131 RepID=UPI00333E7EFB